MPNWLSIAGGAGQGFVQGDEDNMRRQEFQSMQRQRQRVEQQQGIDDKITASMAGIRPPGTYTDITQRTGVPDPTRPWEAAPDFVGPGSGGPTKTTTVSAADAARQRAAVYAASGRPQDIAASAQQEQLGYTADQADSAAQLQKDKDVLRKADQLNAYGDSYSAAQLLAEHSNQHPLLDGHQVVVMKDANGVPHMAVARAGQYVQPPQPVNQQSVAAMIQRGRDTLTPELAQGARKIDIEGRVAGAKETEAQAAQRNADTVAWKAYEEAYGRTGDIKAARSAAENARDYAMAAAEKNRSAAMAANQYSPGVQIIDKDGNIAIMQTVKKGINGIPSEPLITNAPPGYSFPKQPQEWNDRQRYWADLLKLHAQNGTGPYTLTKDGKVDQSAIDAYLTDHELNTPSRGRGGGGSADPNVAAVMAAGPPKPDDKSAPAAPAAPATPEAVAAQKVSDADKALAKFGSKQKRKDAAGYAAVVKARTDAQAELDALNEKYAKTQPTGAAYPAAYPRP